MPADSTPETLITLPSGEQIIVVGQLSQAQVERLQRAILAAYLQRHPEGEAGEAEAES